MNLVEIIDTKNTDDLSAFVTSAFISSTYKVESTRSIVDIWDNIRGKIKVSNNLEYVSAILALGRMMDLKNELEEKRYVEMYNELIATFLEDLKKRGHAVDLHKSNLITAMVTSACISRTEQIETINEIVNQWEEITSKFEIKDDLDKLSTILTIGRINEYKYSIDNINQILIIHKKLRDHLETAMGDRDVELQDMAAAFITSAYLEITPKVERTQDMVKLWEQLLKDLKITDHVDYVTALLTYGRIRDLNAQYFLTDSTILEIRDAIKNHMMAKN